MYAKKINDIKRRGKWLMFDLGDYYLLSHLRMEGKYFVKNSSEEIVKHEHIIITFEDFTDLRYHDTRKFGRMFLTDDLSKCKGLNKLGLEPFDKNINSDYLLTKFNKSNLPIKELLLDQSIIAGLGNIYANEVLFLSKINPFKKGKDITKNECDNIISSSKEIFFKNKLLKYLKQYGIIFFIMYKFLRPACPSPIRHGYSNPGQESRYRHLFLSARNLYGHILP